MKQLDICNSSKSEEFYKSISDDLAGSSATLSTIVSAIITYNWIYTNPILTINNSKNVIG